MRTLGKDKVIYAFRPDCPFAYYVEDGETFWVETEDCYNGMFKSEEDLRTELTDTSRFDAAVGPIHIRGAAPKDTLCVEIIDIQLADWGVMVTARNLGIFGDKIETPHTKIIPVEDGFAFFSEKIRLPVDPMVGVMGVLPESGEFPCTVPGDFGGNMDTKEVAAGTKVYLPVFVKGAGLAISDIHACMGDGELSGTGLEIAGKVCVKVSVIRNRQIRSPILETKDAVYTISTGPVFEETMKKAAMDMIAIFQSRLGLNFSDAYRLLSAACHMGVSQVVNGVYTLKIQAPRYLFD